MNRSRSIPASEEGWQLVVSSHSEDEGSDRSMPASRPQTPAVNLMDTQSCPPTPESERLADTFLCAPFGPGAAVPAPGSHSSRTGTAGPRANSSVEAAGAEVVSLHCLQGLSQEGPLEGFALKRTLATNTPASPASEVASAPEGQAATTEEAEEAVEAVCVEEEMEEEEEGLMDTDAVVGWHGLDGTHIAGMDVLMELLEGLGWTSGVVVDACRAGVLGAQQAIQMVQQTTTQGAALARQGAQAKLAKLLAYVGKLQGGGSPATGLLVSALSLTTLATLAGLVFFMSRCRHLSNALAQRDREYLRLVSKVLNLQAALTRPMAGPVLRHTTSTGGWVSGLVASSLM